MRIVLDDAATAALPTLVGMLPCDVCGDDIAVHEWVDMTADTVTDCDRK